MESILMKMKLVKNLAGFTGLSFIEIAIKQIRLQKKIFLLEVAQGVVVYIPQELSQRNLPSSYKFYDPILSIIQEELPFETKQFFSVQRKHLLERVYQVDFNRELFEKLGLRRPFDEKKKNLAFKYT